MPQDSSTVQFVAKWQRVILPKRAAVARPALGAREKSDLRLIEGIGRIARRQTTRFPQGSRQVDREDAVNVNREGLLDQRRLLVVRNEIKELFLGNDLIGRDHRDDVPRAYLRTQLAADADLKIDRADTHRIAGVSRIANLVDAVDRADRHAGITPRAKVFIEHRKLFWEFLAHSNFFYSGIGAHRARRSRSIGATVPPIYSHWTIV